MDQQQYSSPKDPVTDERIEQSSLKDQRYKSFWRIVAIISNTSLSSFYFGYTIIYLSVIDFDTIMQIFDITIQRNKAQGLLTFCVPIGGLIGSFLSKWFITKFTRRQSILRINYFALIITVFAVGITNIRVYMGIRFLQGVCAGLYSAMVPLHIKQIVPLQLSGSLGVFHQLFITIGIFFCCFFSFILSKIYDDETGNSFWRVIFGFPIVILLCQTIIYHFIFPYETPRYLVEQQSQHQAKSLLKVIYRSDYVDQILKQLKIQNDNSKNIQFNHNSDQNKSKNRVKLTTYLALHLSLLQQMTGISAVSTYAAEIAEGNLTNFKSILPSIINFEQVVTTLISSFLLSKFGRKTILQYGTFGAGLTTFIIGIGFLIQYAYPNASVFLILNGLFLFMANFGLSIGPIVWIYIAEIVKPEILPYTTMMNWGSSAMILLLFPIIKKTLWNENPSLLFLVFSIWCSLSYLINRKYIIETMGKTEEEIRKEYQLIQQK